MSFHLQALRVASINLNDLVRSGIQGIILDLDNTIVSEDDRYLSPNVEDWIEQAKSIGLKLFILSNGKRKYRLKDWACRLDIPAIGKARKPFPTAFKKALNQMKLRSKQVVVIGDSRHTDILGASLSGCSSVQVASLPHPSHWWEKLCGQWLHMTYPPECELWPIEKFRNL
jgi:uncharacterized protein